VNALDLIDRADRSISRTVAALEPADWDIVVAGTWTSRDVLGHVSVSHARTAAVLEGVVEGRPPATDPHDEEGPAFNEAEAARRGGWTVEALVAEYRSAADRLAAAAARVPVGAWSRVGTLAWYPSHGLDDLVAYRIYGHARHHATHLGVAADLGKAARSGER
jgi:Mycothiol maleylpyruvate isomerase N-terminal domain